MSFATSNKAEHSAIPHMITPSSHSDSIPASNALQLDSPTQEKLPEENPSQTAAAIPQDGPPKLTDQTLRLPKKQVIIVFAAASSCVALSFLDQTIVSTALPTISSDLESGKLSSWVASAYLLTSCAVQPLYGRFSDVFSRKTMLLVALAIFFVSSLACALAKTMIQLIVFRAFQGIGGGGLLSLVIIIMSDIVSLKERGFYQAIIEVVIAISNALGPILGSVFAEKVSWRWCFWINLPLTAAAAGPIYWCLPLREVEGHWKHKLALIDYGGAVLTLASTIVLLVPLTWGGVFYPWSSAKVLVPLILSFFIFGGLGIWEWKGPQIPIIPMGLFKNPTVLGVSICTLLTGGVFYTILFYIPQYLQIVCGFGQITSALIFLAYVLGVTLSAVTSGIMSAKTGLVNPHILGGFATWTIAMGLLTTVDESTSVGKLIGLLLFAGLATGQTVQTTIVAIQASVARSDMAVATSVRNYVRLLGGTILLAIAGTIINNTLRSRLSYLPNEILQQILDDPTSIHGSTKEALSEVDFQAAIRAYVRGFKILFYVCTALAGTMFVTALLLIKSHDLKRSEDKDLKADAKEFLEERKKKRKKDVAV